MTFSKEIFFAAVLLWTWTAATSTAKANIAGSQCGKNEYMNATNQTCEKCLKLLGSCERREQCCKQKNTRVECIDKRCQLDPVVESRRCQLKGAYWNEAIQHCEPCRRYNSSCQNSNNCCGCMGCYCIDKICQGCKSGEYVNARKCYPCSGYMGVCEANIQCCLCPECKCQDNICNKRCTNDKECGTGRVCQHFRGGKYCAKRCTASQCHKTFGPLYFCGSTGHCTRCSETGGPCGKKNTECCYGFHQCINNTCQVKPMNCTSRAICVEGRVCVDGHCKLCETDAECGFADLVCKDSKCTGCKPEGYACSSKRECCACPKCNCIGGTCTTHQECKHDAGCPEGKVCNSFGTSNICVNGCSNHSSCSATLGTVGPTFCGSDKRCRNCVGHKGTCDSSIDRCCWSTDECLCEDRALTCPQKKCVTPPPSPCQKYGEGCGNSGSCCSGNCQSNGVRGVCM